jgi:hypothetical protein
MTISEYQTHFNLVLDDNMINGEKKIKNLYACANWLFTGSLLINYAGVKQEHTDRSISRFQGITIKLYHTF